MRLLADENVSAPVVARLRLAGHDVVAVVERAPASCDEDVLLLAQRERRILITEDRDFGELVVRRRRDLVGLVLIELDRLTNANAAERVVSVMSNMGTALRDMSW